jgi:hypothetical protein
MDNTPERAQLGTIFDHTLRSLHGVPDVAHTKATTLRTMTPVLELAQTFIVQTYRARERGDYIFVEYVGTEGSARICLPPAVAEAIGRQREALTGKNRRAAARARAAADKAKKIKPGFLRVKKAGGD